MTIRQPDNGLSRCKTINVVFALLVCCSGASQANVDAAWNAMPTSGDNPWIQSVNSDVSKGNNTGGLGKWELIYSGSTTGRVPINSNYLFLQVNGAVIPGNRPMSAEVSKTVGCWTGGGNDKYLTFTASCSWGFDGGGIYGCSNRVKTCKSNHVVASQQITDIYGMR